MRIELAPIPITSDIHKSVLPMHIGTYLEDGFFPQGILDNIAGFGDTDEEITSPLHSKPSSIV